MLARPAPSSVAPGCIPVASVRSRACGKASLPACRLPPHAEANDLFFGKPLLRVPSPSDGGLDSKPMCHLKPGASVLDHDDFRRERYSRQDSKALHFAPALDLLLRLLGEGVLVALVVRLSRSKATLRASDVLNSSRRSKICAPSSWCGVPISCRRRETVRRCSARK